MLEDTVKGTLNVDDAFLKNDADDTTSGTITAAGFTTAGSLTLGGHAVNDIDLGGEFNDVDDHLMTSAAINDRITSFGYTTNTGDITGVTAGTGLSGGGTSSGVTLNLDVGDLGLVGNGSLDSATNTVAEYAALPVGYAKMMHSNLGTDEGMPLDSQYFYFKKNQVGLSALDYATMANNPKIAAFLANILYIFGQDVLGKDSEGNTILHMMARKVRNKDQDFLIKLGIKPCTYASIGNTYRGSPV